MNIPDFETLRHEIEEGLLERFLRYVRIHTTSDEEKTRECIPSTPGQWELLNLLKDELQELDVDAVRLDEHGYLIARIPGNTEGVSTIGFMAHVDTSSDAPGRDVKPVVHRGYDGGPIRLTDSVVLDPEENPPLADYAGETVITSDGTTLLGADDKAGVAEIMTMLAWLKAHPKVPRGDVEIIFTPDEETGAGMDRFPVDQLKSRYCFTVDGGREGELETECYYARKATVSFHGRVIHPGSARGRLVNAVSMAAAYTAMLPRNESPESTDGRYGNYWAHKIDGCMEEAKVQVYYRSFDAEDMDRRTEALHTFGAAVEAAFPGGKVVVETVEQYRNMREEIDKHPRLVQVLREAYSAAGVHALETPIRGGTDGARLTSMGIPAPNIFTGGMNFHSRSEWAALPAMSRSVAVLLNLVCLWVEQS